MKTKIFTEWILLTFFFLSSLFHLHLFLYSFFFLSFLCWITTGFCKCYCKIMVNTDYGYLLCNFVYTNTDKIEISLYTYVYNKWKAIKNVKYELVLNFKWHFENVCRILIWTIERWYNLKSFKTYHQFDSSAVTSDSNIPLMPLLKDDLIIKA